MVVVPYSLRGEIHGMGYGEWGMGNRITTSVSVIPQLHCKQNDMYILHVSTGTGLHTLLAQ